LKVGGRYGWRLPTIQELHSRIDDTQDPALPAGDPFSGISGTWCVRGGSGLDIQ